MATQNAIDRAIGWIAPQRAAERLRARVQMEAMSRPRMSYQGATRSNRYAFRPIGGQSANYEIRAALGLLRERCRDLVRNNPYAANIVSAISAQVVGAGIIPAVVADGKRRKKAIQDLVKAHLDTPAIDVDGRSNLAAIQALVMRTTVEAGEALIVRYRPPSALKLPVPLQVKVLEPDYLDSSKTGPIPGGNFAFEGIEFDSAGRRVAYYIYNEHPGGSLTSRLPTSSRVPAEDVIHHYRVDRPGQARGVPWGAPVIITINDWAEYEDAALMRQKIAACFAVFITGETASTLAQSVSKTDTTIDSGVPLETIDPGMIYRLQNGQSVSFGNPPGDATYPDFTRAQARKVAAGFSVPYEIATGDLSQVSFISGRFGMLQFNRHVDQWRWHMHIPHLCAGIGRWFIEAADVALGGSSGSRLDWTPPKREMVDPRSEVPPMTELVRSGFTTRSEQTRELGYDPEEVEREFGEENDRADALKLRFDSDGRIPKNTRGSETLPLNPGETQAEPDNGSVAEK